MVLDKITKYINYEENGKAGQRSDGTWYCKEVPFKDAEDLETKINRINGVLNTANKDIEKKSKKE